MINAFAMIKLDVYKDILRIKKPGALTFTIS